jgi:predicted O-linked N-acetylglucosamine transferase (SPINDLY family)
MSQEEALRLAQAFFSAAKYEQARVLCEAVSEKSSLYPEAMLLQGNIAYCERDFESALHFAENALVFLPDNSICRDLCFAAAVAAAKFDLAERHGRAALKHARDVAANHNNLGMALRLQGCHSEALECFRNATALDPNDARLWSNLGNGYESIGEFEEAVKCLERALSLNSAHYEARFKLAICQTNLRRIDQALENYNLLLQCKFKEFDVLLNVGSLQMSAGNIDEAMSAFREARKIEGPSGYFAFSALLFAMSQSADLAVTKIVGEHRAFGVKYQYLATSDTPYSNPRHVSKRLRVGLVSPDFRSHVVAMFLEPVLTHLSKETVELYGYYNNTVNDDVTARFRALFPHWRSIASVSDEDAAKQIRDDGIDILIDMAGHSAFNRLLIFARRPAPVQVSWMGYPGTTGLDAMDYYLADRYSLPSGQFDDQFTEKIVQLPASAPFRPFDAPPDVSPLPALTNGYMTFGSFNAVSKINRPVVALWAQLLRALPDSHMVLGAMAKDGENVMLEGWFKEEGVDRDRLHLYGTRPMIDYLALHHQVDICLDTFPYNGGTTTLHALLMGVPTLTIAGTTPAGRTGVCAMSHVGLQEFAADSKENFVAKGVAWSKNLIALGEIRAGLRERFAQSAVGQPEVVAAGLERALRTMWDRWCNSLLPQSFEVGLDEQPSRPESKELLV